MSILKGLKLQRKFRSIIDNISFFEDLIIKNHKNNYINLDNKCIFITGMPRSGTTILTQTLSKHEDFGSYVYSDLPFTKIPFLWSKFKKIYYHKNESLERIHGDGLKIDLDSPDAFEELIWSENIINYKDNLYKFLDSDYKNSIIEKGRDNK
ncbi:sulfotransferase [Candidatus Pelagibacter communis]|uniref:sulfotransferase n=1 Tax=Pelagibacter ubique TaxID=198252 RepID=UPI00094D1E80|nr:sulfotransferase [Candidatus Pelagibacter ubique]